MPSTAIRSFHYRADRRELEVTFTTGRRYLYFDVPPLIEQAFRAAGSRGRFFNERIRDHYSFRELSPAAT
jgi:lysyl-tRNA synthetase class 2